MGKKTNCKSSITYVVMCGKLQNVKEHTKDITVTVPRIPARKNLERDTPSTLTLVNVNVEARACLSWMLTRLAVWMEIPGMMRMVTVAKVLSPAMTRVYVLGMESVLAMDLSWTRRLENVNGVDGSASPVVVMEDVKNILFAIPTTYAIMNYKRSGENGESRAMPKSAIRMVTGLKLILVSSRPLRNAINCVTVIQEPLPCNLIMTGGVAVSH